MKITVNIARVIVGLLFIFSGLIKANDPLGLSYKMQEFFEIWGAERFNSLTLTMSVLMNAFEIIAGFALLLGWRIRLFSWLLLLLILFFTFLTGYTFITGKPATCGCFGDCLPLSSKTSFLKDLGLTALIAYIFWHRDKIKPIFSNTASALALITITVLGFAIQWYTLTYLPIRDCLPYRISNNIPKEMEIPSDAIFPKIEITYVYEKNGKHQEYAATDLPKDLDSTYKFIKRHDRVVTEGKNYQAPIHDFVLSGVTGEDSTQRILSQPYAVLLFCQDFSVPVTSWKDDFASLYRELKSKNIPAFAITTQLGEAHEQFASTSFSDIPILTCDFTTIRTAARTNPCVLLLQQGTIIDKQSHHRIKQITSRIKSLPALPGNNQ